MKTKDKPFKIKLLTAAAILLPLLIAVVLLEPAFGPVLLLTLAAVVVSGIAKLVFTAGKFKHGELMILGVITLSWGLSAYCSAKWTADYAAARDTVAQSLRECGEMLQNGRQEELRNRLETFLASPVMRKNGTKIAADFHRTVTVDSAAPAPGTVDAAIIRNFLLSWSGMMAVWGILFLCRLKRVRQIFMILCGVAAILAWAAYGIGRAVNGSYFSEQLRFDLNRLHQELLQEHPRPELLLILRNPQMQSYSFLRNLPPLPKSKLSPEASKK